LVLKSLTSPMLMLLSLLLVSASPMLLLPSSMLMPPSLLILRRIRLVTVHRLRPPTSQRRPWPPP